MLNFFFYFQQLESYFNQNFLKGKCVMRAVFMPKCDANCDANRPYSSFLWLRKNIFYYSIEIARVNGKRRYKRISLHTDNYYKAREMMKQINQNQPNALMDKLHFLYNQLIFDTEIIVDGPAGSCGMARQLKTLSKRNNPETLRDLVETYLKIEAERNEQLRSEFRFFMEQVKAVIPEATKMLSSLSMTFVSKQPTQQYTIEQVLDIMLKKAHTGLDTENRKRNTLTKMLKSIGIKMTDSYEKFHTPDTIQKLIDFVLTTNKNKNENKRQWLAHIKELATCGNNLEPEVYKLNIINLLPNIPKSKRKDQKPHLPYTKDELLEMFDPKHDFFKKNPDAFWLCLIALFTGSRMNAAFTLQYADICVEDGINCFNFQENHKIKRLKNEASERTVPINDQLIDLGFLDFFKRKQVRTKAKGTDFIFPKCQTSGGQYNNKYGTRILMPFFKSIGVKSANKDQKDFHSFRKNASIGMQDAGIGSTYINDIIGWEGEGMMAESYSNHTLTQIKEQMDKFGYDFLQPHFDAWKKIMAKK